MSTKRPDCKPLDTMERVKRREAALREALEKHHAHASEECIVFFEQDGKPIEIAVDLGESYQDSALCDLTLDALHNDAGHDFISREQVRPIVEALVELTAGVDLVVAEDWSGPLPIGDRMAGAHAALEHARSLRLLEEKP